MSNAWDDMKRTHEEEYFHKQEQEKKAKLKDKLAHPFSNFERGFSPLTGAPMHKANVAGLDVLNCPEEGTLLLSYADLQTLLKNAEESGHVQVMGFHTFLDDSVKEGE